MDDANTFNPRHVIIDIGLPFYGRSVGGATGLNQPHSGADKSVWGIDDGKCTGFMLLYRSASAPC